MTRAPSDCVSKATARAIPVPRPTTTTVLSRNVLPIVGLLLRFDRPAAADASAALAQLELNWDGWPRICQPGLRDNTCAPSVLVHTGSHNPESQRRGESHCAGGT